MGSSLIKRAASMVGALLLTAGVYGYLNLPAVQAPAATATPTPYTLGPFHGFDRAPIEGYSSLNRCLGCHEDRPHKQSPRNRAFLNMHVEVIDCTGCHISGKGIRPHRFGPEGESVSDYTGRIYAAKKSGPKWTPQLGGEKHEGVRVKGPRCGQCHRRSSPFLNAPGLYDSYSRKIFSSLAILRMVEKDR